MIKTIYKYSVSKLQNNDLKDISKILPKSITLENDGEYQYLVLTTDQIDDGEAFSLVERETNRIFFLTSERLEPVLRKKISPDKTENEYRYLTMPFRRFKKLPTNIDLQFWNKNVSNQLKLWRHSYSETNKEEVIRLWFQIIETTFPDTHDNLQYPVYKDLKTSPHPRTESKLLRDYVSHQQDQVKSSQLKYYCEFLELPIGFYDPTNELTGQTISSRMGIIRKTAWEIINGSLTTK